MIYPNQARPTMDLMDRYLPQHQFAEHHQLRMPVTPARALEVASHREVLDDPLARQMTVLREIPSRVAGALGLSSGLRGRPAFGAANFTLLGRSDSELAFGLVGRFWQADYGLLDVPDAPAFAAIQQAGVAKLVMNFVAEPHSQGTLLNTHTRVWCTDEAACRRFLPYWLLIRPVSGLIRKRLLRRILAAALPG